MKKILCKSRKSGILKASINRLKNLKQIWNLISLLKSLLGKLWDKYSSHQMLYEDASGEVFRKGSAGAHELPCQYSEDPSPTTVSPLASLAPLTKHTQPLASFLTEEHEDHSVLNSISLDIVPHSSLPGHSYWASLITPSSGVDYTSYSILFLSWWCTPVKLFFFSMFVHGKSKQEHLFHHASDPKLWVDPTRWQVESGRPHFFNTDVQMLLNMLTTKRVELKMGQENAKIGSSFKQMSPDYTVYSLGYMVKLLGGKRDTTAQTFWNTNWKSEKLCDSQNFSYHNALGTAVEQKSSQLLWDLTSLHSESLVSTAWVSKRFSTAQCQVVVFNKASASLSVQYQDEEPPQLFQKKPLAQGAAQSQLLGENSSPSVAQNKNLASTSYSFPNLPPFSSSQIKTGRTTCNKSEKEVQSFIPSEDQHLQCPFQNQLKWKKVLFPEIQKTEEVINQPTLNHPQGNCASKISNFPSIVAGDSTSQRLQKRLKQNIQKILITDKQQFGPPCKIPASHEQMQPQDKFPKKSQCQRKGKPGPSQPTQSALAVKYIQKMKSKLSERLCTRGSITFNLDFPSKGLEPEMQRQPLDLTWSTGSPSGKIQNGNKEASESYLRRTRKGASERDLSTGPGKKILKNILQDHLSRKLLQVKEGMIPVCVRGSWLAANSALPKSSMHTKPTHLASSKDQQSYVNTSQELPFLDAGTHLKLETNIMKSRVRRRWRTYHQALDPINCSIGEAQASPIPQPASTSSGSHDYRAMTIAKISSLLDAIPQKCLGKRVIRKISFPTWKSPIPAPSPSEKRTWTETPLGGSHGTSEGCMTSQSHTYSPLNKKQQSRGVMEKERILMDKLGPQYRSSPTEFYGHKEEPHTLVGRQSCQPRGSSSPEQANPKGHSSTNKWIRDCNRTWKAKTPETPATPFQHRPIGVSSSSHLHHYPTRFFQNGVLHGQPTAVSFDFLNENHFRKT